MAVAQSGPSLGEVLVRDGIITPDQLQGALKEQRESSLSLGRVVVDMGFITEATRIDVLKRAFGFDVIRLSTLKIDPATVVLIADQFAIKHNVIPIRREGEDILVVAMEDPSDKMVLAAIREQVGMKIKPYIGASDELTDAVAATYGTAEPVETDLEEAIEIAPRGPSLGYRVAQSLFFPIFCFSPLLGFFLAIWLSNSFQVWLLMISQGKTFDIGLYTVLLWALWSIILFEINALIFKPDEEDEEEDY